MSWLPFSSYFIEETPSETIRSPSPHPSSSSSTQNIKSQTSVASHSSPSPSPLPPTSSSSSSLPPINGNPPVSPSPNVSFPPPSQIPISVGVFPPSSSSTPFPYFSSSDQKISSPLTSPPLPKRNTKAHLASAANHLPTMAHPNGHINPQNLNVNNKVNANGNENVRTSLPLAAPSPSSSPSPSTYSVSRPQKPQNIPPNPMTNSINNTQTHNNPHNVTNTNTNINAVANAKPSLSSTSSASSANGQSVQSSTPSSSPSTLSPPSPSLSPSSSFPPTTSSLSTTPSYDPIPSPRVLAHQRAISDHLKELLRENKVSHWIGLSNAQRCDLALLLTKEHLVHYENSDTSTYNSQLRFWIYSYWLSCDISIQGLRVTNVTKESGEVISTRNTKYTIHFDENGKLTQFDQTVEDDPKCIIQ